MRLNKIFTKRHLKHNLVCSNSAHSEVFDFRLHLVLSKSICVTCQTSRNIEAFMYPWFGSVRVGWVVEGLGDYYFQVNA